MIFVKIFSCCKYLNSNWKHYLCSSQRKYSGTLLSTHMFFILSFTFLVTWELCVYQDLTKSLILTFFQLQSKWKIWAFLIIAQPFLQGYPMKDKLPCGHFHGHGGASMLLFDGVHHAVSFQHLHHVLGHASLSKFVGGVPLNHALSQFLIARQYCNGHILCKQSWLD